MKRALTLLHCHTELLAKHIDTAVVGHFQVVDAGHDARKVVVGRERCFTALAHHSQRRCEVLES